jgi:Tol biopolymer transport system component
MRTFIVADAVAATAAAQRDAPQTIAFNRVFPNAGQIGLFFAARDGSRERPLLAQRDVDYNATWSPDGAWIVFTSERAGSADLPGPRPCS